MGPLLNIYLIGKGPRPFGLSAVQWARDVAPDSCSTPSINIADQGSTRPVAEEQFDSAIEHTLYFGDGPWPRPSLSVDTWNSTGWFLGLALPASEAYAAQILKRLPFSLPLLCSSGAKVIAVAVGNELQASAESLKEMIEIWDRDPECRLLLVEVGAAQQTGAAFDEIEGCSILVRLRQRSNE